MKKKAGATAAKKTAGRKKPAAKSPAGKKAAAKKEPSMSGPATEAGNRPATYTPPPVQGIGRPPFRYPPQ
ncbi:MAG TPA: hypothetical protein VEW48_00535 [Thermoanaerobaculia bacterium]|nr:hypothetical protein [Thermoanaerobaculia bacterium]